MLIAGGGAVGSALACALAELPLDVVLVEARETQLLAQPSFDARVTALANGSQQILCGLDLWRELKGYTEAIRTIHISERGRFGAARIEAGEQNVPALGYTVENQALGRVLWERLQRAPRLTVLAPAKVAGLAARARLRHGHRRTRRRRRDRAREARRRGRRRALSRARRRSASRPTSTTTGSEPLSSIAAPKRGSTAAPSSASRSVAPIALLPLTGGRARRDLDAARRRCRADRGAARRCFRAELQAAFGQRLGRFTRIGERHLYTLARVASGAIHGERAVLIGDAALRLHPVAGQGFNLALRDVATLAEVIADATACGTAGRHADVGAAELLERYAAWRAADRQRVSSFTHGLIQLFGESAPGIGLGRGLGLMAFDLLPGAKALLARQTMGKAGRLPRLARGLRLV